MFQLLENPGNCLQCHGMTDSFELGDSWNLYQQHQDVNMRDTYYSHAPDKINHANLGF